VAAASSGGQLRIGRPPGGWPKQAPFPSECDGPYKDGSKPTSEALTEILASLKKGQRPNLCGANLYNVILPRQYLSGINFQGAALDRAFLPGAYLYGANFEKAFLVAANLQGANLNEANLKRASLGEAMLQGAFLHDANLEEADLIAAKLEQASLIGTSLKGADLQGANLAAVIFEPLPGSLPSIPSLVLAKNLRERTFDTSPHALVELREAFKKLGLREQERQVTYAIEHAKRLQDWDQWANPRKAQKDTRSWLEKFLGKEDKRQWSEMVAGKSESLFNYVLFELPCDYGMSPGRLLRILGYSIGLFSLVYMIALFTTRGRAGVWAVWPTDRVYTAEGEASPSRVTPTFFFPRLQGWAEGRWWGMLVRGLGVPLFGLYFSILSAFSLGWRELTIGTWIARVQPREYTLHATGWVRTVSGLQSLLSIYLLALWVLTYFSRPFE
jgi:hypothetical protein